MTYLKIINSKLFNKIIKHSKKHSFLNPNVESDYFNFGILGERIRQNVLFEWTRSNVLFREMNVFQIGQNGSKSSEGIKDGYQSAMQLSGHTLPFGLARQIPMDAAVQDDVDSGTVTPCSGSCLQLLGFFNAQDARNYFFKWQLTRKRWWRMFSRDPGRFGFGKCESDSTDVATITGTQPCAEFHLETISYLGEKWLENFPSKDLNVFSVSGKKKRNFPHLVESKLSLELATLLYLVDSYHEVDDKSILSFHRKMAPYKFGFLVESSGVEERNELLDLCKMMCLDLRKRGVPTLWPSEADPSTTLSFYDSIGVSYVVLVNSDTLTTGIFGLRDRDTTLKEEVHISQFADYGELLVKNYEIKNF